MNVCSQSFSRVRLLDTKQGLSENFVTSICEGNNGLMWFGTFDGLNMYDGYTIKAFKNNPEDSLSVPPGAINEILEDADKQLWIATDNSAGRFDPVNRTFHHVHFKTFIPTTFFNISILSNNFLLLHGYGVNYIINKKNMIAEPANIVNQNNEPLFNLGLYKTDSLGRYIAGSEDTVAWVAGTNRFCLQKKATDISTNAHLHIFKDSKQRIWDLVVKTPIPGYAYICLYNDLTKTIDQSVLKKTGSNFYFSSSILEDAYGNIWVATHKGLLLMRDSSKKFEFAGNFNNSLSYGCNKIHIDKNNILWVATRGKGVIEIDLNPVPFHHYTFPVNKKDSLTRNVVLGIFSYKGKILARHGLGLDNASIIDLRDRSIKKVTGMELPEIKKIRLFENNYALIARRNKHLDYYNWLHKNRNDLFISHHAALLPKPHPSFQEKEVSSFFQKPFDCNRSRWQGDTLWIGTTSSGLIAWAFNNNTRKEYRYDKNTSSICSNTIMDFLFDSAGNIWIATTSGLDYFNKQANNFTHYSTKNGLPDNAVYNLTYDKKGRIWLGTGKGLSCMDTSKKTFFNFNTRDGLINSEYNRFSAHTTPDGTIFMGGMDGIDYFDPGDILLEADILEPVVTNVEVNNKPVNYTNQLTLSSTENNLHVTFAVNRIAKAGTASYAYQLVGSSDTAWQTIGNSNELRFASLAPGKYTLKIKAINQHNEWSRLTEILRFTIAPNWHQATWFKLIIAMILFGVGILLARYYTEQKLHKQSIIFEKKQAVALERSRISAELHDDLGSGLSTIRILSQSLNGSEGNIGKNPNLEKISSHSHELIQKLREIVWALNNENDTLEQLISYIRLQASTLLDNAGISYRYQIPELIPEIKVTGGNRRHIHLLVKEAVHNIIKHARATEVLFTITITDDLAIAIHDNGIGIPADCTHKPSGNGIKNMKKHTEAVQGLLAIENHTGTTIQFSVPLQSLSHESVI